MASVSAMSVMKAKAVKKKVYARKTAPNMVSAGKANASATRDGVARPVLNSRTKRSVQMIALVKMVSAMTDAVFVPRSTLDQVVSTKKNVQTTAADTESATWANACVIQVTKAMRVKKISHATAMVKVLAREGGAIAYQDTKAKVAKSRQSAHKTALVMVSAAVKRVTVIRVMLEKRVPKMQKKPENRHV